MNYSSCHGIVYTVNNGDSLYRISEMFGVPLEVLLDANPYADVYNLQIGDTICIPMPGVNNMIGLITYVVKDNDTIIDILNRFHIDFDELMEYNRLGSLRLKEGTALQIPQRGTMDEE
ncbi:LysM peptidoglycan-binding domain-containing protein [Clostridium sp. Marseille-P299]|uniref:LysM peptidoglycan-binding domain-containing protein n=1 Tax=Clostridium sp. Marseille-P299 TaxID=1805477 RepID=UPI000833D110|nr:LysM peptidoglycan-binding domain-containing protein [Clostridium sp. Marseille-P299]